MGHVRVLARKDAGVCLGCDEAQKTWKVARRSVAHFVSVQGFWSLHRAIMEKPRLNSIMCSSDLRQVSRSTLCVVPQMRKIGLPSFFFASRHGNRLCQQAVYYCAFVVQEERVLVAAHPKHITPLPCARQGGNFMLDRDPCYPSVASSLCKIVWVDACKSIARGMCLIIWQPKPTACFAAIPQTSHPICSYRAIV
jgi:hypothetical protein